MFVLQVAPDFAEHGFAIDGRGIATHDRRPDRSGVVHVGVDVAGTKRIECDGRTKRRQHVNLATRGVRDRCREHPGKDVLLGERLRTDDDPGWTRSSGRRHERQRGVRVEQAEHRKDRNQRRPLSREHCGTECTNQPVEQQGQRRSGHASDENRGQVPRLQTGEDVVAEARCTHWRGQRGHPHRPHRRRPKSGKNHR